MAVWNSTVQVRAESPPRHARCVRTPVELTLDRARDAVPADHTRSAAKKSEKTRKNLPVQRDYIVAMPWSYSEPLRCNPRNFSQRPIRSSWPWGLIAPTPTPDLVAFSVANDRFRGVSPRCETTSFVDAGATKYNRARDKEYSGKYIEDARAATVAYGKTGIRRWLVVGTDLPFSGANGRPGGRHPGNKPALPPGTVGGVDAGQDKRTPPWPAATRSESGDARPPTPYARAGRFVFETV